MDPISTILSDTDERLNLALRSTRVTVVTQDLSMRYLTVLNPVPGYGSRIIGKTPQDIYSPEQAEIILRDRQQVIDTGTPFHDQLKLELDGVIRYFDSTVHPIFNDKRECIGTTSISVEITDLVEAQKALSRANDNLLRLLEETLNKA